MAGDTIPVVVEFTGDTSALRSETSKAEGAFGKLAGAAVAMGAAIATGFVAKQVIDFAGQAVNAAKDLNETVNKTETIFGDSSAEILAWSETAAKTMGLSKNEALSAASGFQNMFTQLGLGADQAKDMSKGIVRISSDLASFNNVSGGAAEVTQLVNAAMIGEYDSIQKLVPTINAAAVESRALADTGKATAKELTGADKAAATYALIMEGAGAATGDFAKTSSSLANSQQIAGAQMDDMKARIGQGLLPVVNALVNIFSTFLLPIIEEVASKLVSFVKPAFEQILAAIVRLWPQVQAFARTFRDALAELWPKVQQLGATIVSVLVPAIQKIWAAIQKAAPPILDLFRDLATDLLPKVCAAFRVIAPVVATVAAKLIELAGWLAQNRDVLTAIVIPIAAAIAAIKTIQIVTQAWTAIQAAFNAVMAANPIVLVVIAIAALVAAVYLAYQRVDWFRDFVDTAFRAIVAAFGWLKDAAVTVFNWIKDNWPLLLAILTGPFGIVVAIVVKNFDTIKNAVMGVVDWIRNNWQLLLAILTGPIGIAVKLITDNWQTLKDAATGLFNWVKEKFEAIAGVIDGVVGGIRTAIGHVVNAIKAPINLVIRSMNALEFTIPKIEIKPPIGPSLSAGPWTIDVIPGKIPELAGGGYITQTGLAVVHRGETVSSGGGNVYNVNVNVGAGTDPARVGRTVVDFIRAYERSNGTDWRTGAAL